MRTRQDNRQCAVCRKPIVWGWLGGQPIALDPDLPVYCIIGRQEVACTSGLQEEVVLSEAVGVMVDHAAVCPGRPHG